MSNTSYRDGEMAATYAYSFCGFRSVLSVKHPVVVVAPAEGVYGSVYEVGDEYHLVLNTDGALAEGYTEDQRVHTTIDIANGIDEMDVDEVYGDYNYSITKVIIEEEIRPTSTECYFYCFEELIEIENIENLNTSYVTSMYSMFGDCMALTELDVSSFDTSNVTNMEYMFGICVGLTELDLSNFDTSSVTDMREMFYYCRSLERIYVSDGWSLESLDYGGYAMFEHCYALVGAVAFDSTKTDGTMANWEDGYLTYISKETTEVYASLYQVGSEYHLVFNTDGELAEGYTQDQIIGVSGDITNGTSTYLNQQFRKMVNMEFWGQYALDITKIKIEEKIVPKSTKCYFAGLYELTEIEGLELIDTSNVTSMQSMFSNNYYSGALDLSRFVTDNVTDMMSMFSNCTGLTTIYVSGLWSTKSVTDQGEGMFYGNTRLVGTVAYDSTKTDVTMANYKTGYLTKKEL